LATLVTAGASYAGGKDLYVGNSVANLNAIPLTALAYRDQLNDEVFNRSLRPYPQYKSLNVGGMYPLGRYLQESASVSVEKRATAGLSLTFSYNWTRRWDDYSGGRQDVGIQRRRTELPQSRRLELPRHNHRPGDDLVLLVVTDMAGDVTLAELAKRSLNERIAQLPSNALAGLLETVQTAAALGDAILAKAGVRLAVLFITDSDVSNYREDFTNPTVNWTDSGDISRRFRDGLIREKISKLDASLEAVETPVFILHLAYRTDTLNQVYQTGLMTLAASTGGSSYFCRSQTEIPDVMGKAFAAIASQYSLTVPLPRSLPKTVDVTLESSGLSLTWRSRFALRGE
jgi:hypothetical protein